MKSDDKEKIKAIDGNEVKDKVGTRECPHEVLHSYKSIGYKCGSELPSCQSKQRNTVCYKILCASMAKTHQLLRRAAFFCWWGLRKTPPTYVLVSGVLDNKQPCHQFSGIVVPTCVSSSYVLSNNLSKNLNEQTRVKQSCPVAIGWGLSPISWSPSLVSPLALSGPCSISAEQSSVEQCVTTPVLLNFAQILIFKPRMI